MKQSQSSIVPFRFESQDVRTVKDEKGEPLFVAKDVCTILELSDVNKAVSNLDDDEKGTNKVRTPGGVQDMITVNESGLYALIFRSNKPEAKKFRKWVTSEVLPAIRKTGSYNVLSKECAKCRKVLPLSDFQKDSRKRDGRHSYCPDCRANEQRLRIASKRIETHVKHPQQQSSGIDPTVINKLYLKALYFITDCHELLRKAS